MSVEFSVKMSTKSASEMTKAEKDIFSFQYEIAKINEYERLCDNCEQDIGQKLEEFCEKWMQLNYPNIKKLVDL